MRLCCHKRSRVIQLFIDHNLVHQKKKFNILSDLAKMKIKLYHHEELVTWLRNGKRLVQLQIEKRRIVTLAIQK